MNINITHNISNQSNAPFSSSDRSISRSLLGNSFRSSHSCSASLKAAEALVLFNSRQGITPRPCPTGRWPPLAAVVRRSLHPLLLLRSCRPRPT
jgi:hypothetical protein